MHCLRILSPIFTLTLAGTGDIFSHKAPLNAVHVITVVVPVLLDRPVGHETPTKQDQFSSPSVDKTASFQKEAMRTQVALYFVMKWNLCRVVYLCLNNQNVQNRQVEKSLLL